MRKVVLGIILILQMSCHGQHQKTVKEPIKTLQDFKLKQDSLASYASIKASIHQQQQNLNTSQMTKDSLSTLFQTSLVNRIIPFWEGTEWSFEGHTSIPKKGTVACGYFVSTTLRDAGLNLNRYRLAQQSPINEANTLALSSKVIEISENSIQENIAKIRTRLKNGIHFIGFDASHVGFILKEDQQLYLIHSNYIQSKGVEIEPIESSQVFASYNRFYLTELSTNETFLKRWANKEAIKVITKE